jgi:predicted extracellular nuclease
MSKKLFMVATAIAAAFSSVGQAQVVINEIWNGSSTDEYVEFYNTSASSVDVSGWTLVRRTNTASSDSSTIYTFPASTSIASHAYYTIADSGAGITADGSYTNVISTGNQSIGLKDSGGNVIDGVGFGTGTIGSGTGFYSEPSGTPAPFVLSTGSGAERDPNGTDTNNNASDFSNYTTASGKTPGISNDTVVAATDVANIAAARALGTGEVRITGPVIVTSRTNGLGTRNQFTVQDASGTDGQSAILIDDNAFTAGVNVTEGDTITNLQGSLSSFSGLMQLTPTQAVSPTAGTAPAPLVLTNGVTSIDDIEAELIRVNGASVGEGDGVATWAANTNYTLVGPTGLVVSVIRIEDNSELVGQVIPTGNFDMVGIAIDFNGTGELEPRFISDVTASSAVNNWALY